VVEMMYSLETILEITGDVQFADHLERVAYNALPAQITDDFMERQYFQQANQVNVTRENRNFSLNHGGTDVCFGLFTGYPCCTSNMHQGWPIFTQNAWYATTDGGLAALYYAPTEVTAQIGDGTEITIVEETNYPFEDNVRFEINIPEGKQVSFPFKLRIPEWSKEASVMVNGEEFSSPKPNQVITINRQWTDKDVVELKLPAQVELNRWHERAVSVDRGPLNFVLKIDAKWEKVNNTKDPDRYGEYYYEVTPQSPWNYGLIDVAEDKIQEQYELIRKQHNGSFPWNPENAPLEIKTEGRRMLDWKLYNGSAGPLPYSNQYGAKTGDEVETITLIPYGCSSLRVSEFPLVGNYHVMR
jgi:hypothetical protein